MDQQRFLRRRKFSETFWAAENYGKILWAAELGRRKITEKQISGGRFQAADILGCRISDGRPGTIKNGEKNWKFGGRNRWQKKSGGKFRNFLKSVFEGRGIIQVFQKKIPQKRLFFPEKFRGSFLRNFQKMLWAAEKYPV